MGGNNKPQTFLPAWIFIAFVSMVLSISLPTTLTRLTYLLSIPGAHHQLSYDITQDQRFEGGVLASDISALLRELLQHVYFVI